MRLLLILVLCIANAAALAAGRGYSADDAAQDVWLLENGEQREWIPALRRLMRQRHLPKLAVASVLRRMEVLDARDRLTLCKALGTALADPRAQAALLALARDWDAAVRDVARSALVRGARHLAPETLLDLAAEQTEQRIRFLRAWTNRYGVVTGVGSSRLEAARRAAAGALRDYDPFAILSRLSTDPDERVARRAVEAMGLLIDTRVEDRLFELGKAGNLAGYWQLAYRGDARAFEPLVQQTSAEARRARSDWNRLKAFERAGNYLPALFFPRLVELYREARDPQRKEGAQRMIKGQLGLGLLDDPAARRELGILAGDPDDFLRSSAQKALEWERRRENERTAPARQRRALLVGGALTGIGVGLLMFLLAFRLLLLKRFVKGLPSHKIRSVPAGLVALSGRVEAYQDGTIAHPFTGERCVIHPGVRLPFWLDDGTGRILVDPAGAALLSVDGIVVPGEEVLVVGTYRNPALAGGTGGARHLGGNTNTVALPSIRRSDHEMTGFARTGGWLVRALTRVALGQSAARMMFLDARQCFWIWDNLDQRPFDAEHESTMMAAGAMFAGAWLLVVVVAILGIASG
jgi:hypothetical protein